MSGSSRLYGGTDFGPPVVPLPSCSHLESNWTRADRQYRAGFTLFGITPVGIIKPRGSAANSGRVFLLSVTSIQSVNPWTTQVEFNCRMRSRAYRLIEPMRTLGESSSNKLGRRGSTQLSAYCVAARSDGCGNRGAGHSCLPAHVPVVARCGRDANSGSAEDDAARRHQNHAEHLWRRGDGRNGAGSQQGCGPGAERSG